MINFIAEKHLKAAFSRSALEELIQMCLKIHPSPFSWIGRDSAQQAENALQRKLDKANGRTFGGGVQRFERGGGATTSKSGNWGGGV